MELLPIKKVSNLGLFSGTVITKVTKEPNNRVLLRALLFGCFVSFVLGNGHYLSPGGGGFCEGSLDF